MPRNLMDTSQNKNSNRAKMHVQRKSGVPLPIQLRFKSESDQSWLVRWHEPIINGRRTTTNHYSSFLQVKVTSVLSNIFLSCSIKNKWKKYIRLLRNVINVKEFPVADSMTSWYKKEGKSSKHAPERYNYLVLLWDMIKRRWKCYSKELLLSR